MSNANVNFDFTFSTEEANLILDALSHRPFRDVVAIVNKIQTVANKQTVKRQEALVAEAKAKVEAAKAAAEKTESKDE